MSRSLRALVLVLGFLSAAMPAFGQQRPRSGDAPRISLQGGIGFTASPESFLMAFEAPYEFDEHIAVGPALQLGLDDRVTLVSPSIQARFTFDPLRIPSARSEALSRVRPYAEAGLGFTFIDLDRRGPRDDDDLAFLFNFGIGAEYEVSETLRLGTGMRFNITPGGLMRDEFHFSWQLLTTRVRF